MSESAKSASRTIYIDQTSAERALEKLVLQADKLEKAIDKGTAAGKDMTEQIAKLGETKNGIKEVQEAIDKGLRPSMKQQEQLVKKLRNSLKRMSEDAPGHAEKFKAYRAATAELDRMKASLNGVEKAQNSWMQQAKTVAFGVLIGNTVQSAVQALGSYLSGIVSGNAKLSDSIADIEKATGLSSKAVQDLNKQLGSIDTRTATSDLREVAIGLGQVGQEANKANVEALDKIVVALGDEFGGGAKEITTSLSVLRNNLSDIKTGNYAEDILHIGNALNVAGAEGLATAPVVTDIANRIAGIGRTFKLSSGQILGLAATFQELGIETERGSTAVQKLFQKIGAEPEKFAKITKLSAKEFKDLVNRDMLGAFQEVAEGAKKAGANNIVFSKILKELDADGSGAGEVLSKLGENADLLSDKVDSMTAALKSGSSITEEFGKKNNTLGAELEKLNKQFNGLIQSKTLTDIFRGAVKLTSQLIDALKAVPTFLKENETAVYFLITGIVLLRLNYIKLGLSIAKKTVATVADTLATRIQAASTALSAAAQLTYGLIVDVVTKKIKLATAASLFYSVILKSSLGPIGAVISLIGGLTLALTYLFSRTKDVTAAQQKANLEVEKSKKLNEAWNRVQEEGNRQIASTVSRMEKYVKTAEDTTKTDEERRKAIQSIININPEYFKGLDLEAVKTGVLRTKVDEYTEALKAAAQQKAIFDKRVSLEQQKLDLQSKLDPAEITGKDGKPINFKLNKIQDGIQIQTAGEKLLAQKNKKIVDDISIVEAQLSFLDKKEEELKNKTKNIPGLVKEENTVNAINPFDDKKTPEEKAAERKAQKELSKREALLKQLKDFQFELSQVGKQADESEIARITKKYDELIKEAHQYGISFIELEKEKNRAVGFLIEKELNDRRKQFDKAFLETAKEEYQQALVLNSEYFDGLKDNEADRYSTGAVTKKQYEDNIKQIDKESLAQQVKTAEDYSLTVKEAAKDVNKFKKQQRKDDLKDAIANADLQKDIDRRNGLANAQINVALSPEGTKKRLDAQLKLLQVERDQALANENLTETEKERIRIEYRQREAQATLQFYAAQIQQSLEFISQGLDILSKFNDARAAKEKAQLDKELKANELKKSSIRRLEESKVISAQESRRRLRVIEIEEERKKEELEKKQQARARRIAIAQAIINGALAVTSTLAAIPGPIDILSLGAARYIQIGLAVAATAAQIATISAQKYAEGGKVKQLKNGRINEQRNIPTQPNGDDVLATVKVGEVILNEDQQRKAGGPSFFKALGVPGFAGGGRIKPFWETRPYQALNYPAIVQSHKIIQYANGGLIKDQPVNSTPAAPTGNEQGLSEKQERLMEDQRQLMAAMLVYLQNPVPPQMSLKTLEDAQALKDRRRKAAGGG